jgi:hypothetical protein
VGDATDAEVAQAIERLWGGPETCVVVSSDLSHYYPYHLAGVGYPGIPVCSAKSATTRYTLPPPRPRLGSHTRTCSRRHPSQSGSTASCPNTTRTPG